MHSPARVLIVDDEEDARNKIALFLKKQAGFEVVGEAKDGEEALTLAYSLVPDLIFLDIQMPRTDGFTVAANLVDDPRIRVIFVTAYDRYAVGAFELNAVDYLLKPFDRERFESALKRFSRSTCNDQSERIPMLIKSYRENSHYPEKLVFRSDTGLELVSISRIEWVESSGNYVKVCLKDHAFLARQTMVSVQNQLPDTTFVRIHRSFLVNIDRVSRIRSLQKGDYEVEMESGAKLRLSRNYANDFLTRFRRPE
jgi:two-component system, LytTR family, response regulator